MVPAHAPIGSGLIAQSNNLYTPRQLDAADARCLPGPNSMTPASAEPSVGSKLRHHSPGRSMASEPMQGIAAYERKAAMQPAPMPNPAQAPHLSSPNREIPQPQNQHLQVSQNAPALP